MDTHKTVADMAASKFTNMLNRFHNLVTTGLFFQSKLFQHFKNADSVFPQGTFCSVWEQGWGDDCWPHQGRLPGPNPGALLVKNITRLANTLPSVTLYSQGTIIGMNWGSQLPEVNNCQICQQKRFFSSSFCWSDHVSSSLCFKTSPSLSEWEVSDIVTFCNIELPPDSDKWL